MKKLILITLLLVGIAQIAYGQNEKTPKIITESFWVNGNCEMCQNRIQKAALSVKGVKLASWDIDNKILKVIYKPGKCSLEDIQKAVASVGHDNVGFRAPDEVYNNLHHCCLYDRVE
jgi:copper chaperone CopZ